MTHAVCHAPESVTSDIPYRSNRLYIDNYVTSPRHHSAKVLSRTARNSIVAMVIDLWSHLTSSSKGARHTMYVMLPSNYMRDAL